MSLEEIEKALAAHEALIRLAQGIVAALGREFGADPVEDAPLALRVDDGVASLVSLRQDPYDDRNRYPSEIMFPAELLALPPSERDGLIQRMLVAEAEAWRAQRLQLAERAEAAERARYEALRAKFEKAPPSGS